MPNILLLDPDDTQRAVTREMMSVRGDWSLIEAASGEAAREQLRMHSVDLAVIDVSSPGPDEQEFFAWLRREEPRVPVILLTADELQDEATIQTRVLGAASFVPRSSIARDLVARVERVLDLSGHGRRHVRLLEGLVRSETVFEVRDNDLAMIPVLVGHLMDSAEECGICTNGNRMQVAVALEEAISNGIVHGNLEVSSRLREEHHERFHRLIGERRCQSPYRERSLHVRGVFRPGECCFTITDEGPGFDPQAVADPTRPQNIERPHGRGLFLIRAFMDEVSFHGRGNEIRLVKRSDAHSD